MGPQTYDSVGNETYLTTNRIPKGAGNEHLVDSNISDDGSKVTITGGLDITGAVSASTFTGLGNLTTYSASVASRLLTFATTGSNTFVNTQNISLTTSGQATGLKLTNLNGGGGDAISIDFSVSGGGTTMSRLASNRTTVGSDLDVGLLLSTYSGSLTEKMRIQGNGFVGIGTTSPTQLVHVFGGGSAKGLVVETNTAHAAYVETLAGGVTRARLQSNNSAGFVGMLTNHPFSIYANNGEAMYLTSGSVGIGTNDTTFKLQVLGESRLIQSGDNVALYLDSINVGHATRLRFRKNAADYFSLDLRGSGESDVLNLYRYSAGNWSNPIITFRNDTNNVGISTTSPSNLLSIRGNMDMGATGLSYVGPSQYGGIVFPRGQILFSNSNTQNQLYLSSNAYTNSSGVFAYRNSAQPALAFGLDNGGVSFNTAGNGTADVAISWNTPLIIDNTGVYMANTNTPINIKPENTPSTAITSLSSASSTYNQRPGVYWLNFGSQIFLGYVKFNWHQGRNWVLALKCHNVHDMPAGSALWQNNTLVNQSDFNLQSGRMAKYGAWNNFPFTRLLYEMGNRIPPIMQWNAQKTSLYSVLSGISVGNGSGVGPDSTDPQISTSASTTYSSMTNFLGANFPDFGGAEPILNYYGLGSFANVSSNSTSAANTGIASGFGLTTEHLGTFSSLQSTGRAGAWIGCPMDEAAAYFNRASSGGADSGFGLGVAGGNNPRTSTSGIISWALGNSVANFLPAYVWLSID